MIVSIQLFKPNFHGVEYGFHCVTSKAYVYFKVVFIMVCNSTYFFFFVIITGETNINYLILIISYALFGRDRKRYSQRIGNMMPPVILCVMVGILQKNID